MDKLEIRNRDGHVLIMHVSKEGMLLVGTEVMGVITSIEVPSDKIWNIKSWLENFPESPNTVKPIIQDRERIESLARNSIPENLSAADLQQVILVQREWLRNLQSYDKQNMTSFHGLLPLIVKGGKRDVGVTYNLFNLAVHEFVEKLTVGQMNTAVRLLREAIYQVKLILQAQNLIMSADLEKTPNLEKLVMP